LEERYSMGEYVVNRIISCVLMMLCTCVYGIATRCSGEKFAALLLIVGTKMIDAFADVFEGQLQKEHRLDLAGISMTIRMAVTTLLCLAADGYAAAHGCLRLHVPGRGFCLAAFSVAPALGASSARRVAASGDFFAEEHCAFCAGLTAVLFVLWLMMIAGMPKYAIDF
ncbi:MAG: hypothetical protein ACLT0Y_09335, partial [Christensenellales bacterium]